MKRVLRKPSGRASKISVVTLEEKQRLDKLSWRNLHQVAKAIEKRFSRGRCKLEYFAIIPDMNTLEIEERPDGRRYFKIEYYTFGAYMFFKTEADVEYCIEHGVVEQIKEAYYEEMERAGRGTREELERATSFCADIVANSQMRLRSGCPDAQV